MAKHRPYRDMTTAVMVSKANDMLARRGELTPRISFHLVGRGEAEVAQHDQRVWDKAQERSKKYESNPKHRATVKRKRERVKKWRRDRGW